MPEVVFFSPLGRQVRTPYFDDQSNLVGQKTRLGDLIRCVMTAVHAERSRRASDEGPPSTHLLDKSQRFQYLESFLDRGMAYLELAAKFML